MGMRSHKSSSDALNYGSDRNRRCMGRSSSRYVERQQTHPLVMRHETAERNARLAAGHARGCEIDRFIKSVRAVVTVCRQPFQILARLPGRDHQRQRRRVRRDDQIVGETALESQARHAERAVLINALGVGGVVARLGNAPRHAALAAVFDLAGDDRPVRLVEQRVLEGRHHQQRHQVLEHRAAPRQQRHRAVVGGQLPAQGKPMILRQLVLGHENETRQPRFRGEQVVIRRIAATVGDVVADRQQIAGRIVQEGEVHHRQLGATLGELVDLPDPLDGAFAPGGRAGQLLQRRHVIELLGIVNEELQIVPRGVALPGESLRPPSLLRVAIDGQRGDIPAEFLE